MSRKLGDAQESWWRNGSTLGIRNLIRRARIEQLLVARDRDRFRDSTGDDADGDGEKRHIQKCTCRLGEKSLTNYVKDAQTLSGNRRSPQMSATGRTSVFEKSISRS